MSKLSPVYINPDDPWSSFDFETGYPQPPFCFANNETSLPDSYPLADPCPPTETSYPDPPFRYLDEDFIKRPLIAMDEETAKEAQLLQAELDQVEKEISDLQSQKTDLLSEFDALEREDTEAMGQVVVTPLKPHVVAFVGKLEQGHLYYKLKEFLKKSDLLTYDAEPGDALIDHLFANQQGMTEFHKLDRVHIRTGLSVRIEELRRRDGYPIFREDYKLYKQEYCPGWGDTTQVSEAEKELEAMYPTVAEEVVDQFVIVDHFVSLLHRMRTENYVMDENPEVELEKLLRCFPLVYQDSELVYDPIRLMTPPPDMGNDIDEVFTEAVNKYKEICNAAFMTRKRQRSVSSGSSMSP